MRRIYPPYPMPMHPRPAARKSARAAVIGRYRPASSPSEASRLGVSTGSFGADCKFAISLMRNSFSSTNCSSALSLWKVAMNSSSLACSKERVGRSVQAHGSEEWQA